MSRVTIVGGAGFIGRNVAAALAARGQMVRVLSRAECDLASFNADEAARALADSDCVVNCAGLVRARKGESLDAVHAQGTALLAESCRRAGVRRLIHLSALGADAAGGTDYQRSKGRGEALLETARDFDVCVVRPSLVIGRGGASTALFGALAALPVVPRFGVVSGAVQPIAIDDLCDLVARMVEREGELPRRLDAVGPEPMSVDELVEVLGAWLGVPRRMSIRLSGWALAGLARVAEILRLGPINRETLAMLRAGNVSDPAPIRVALGRAPQMVDQALARNPAAPADRLQARLYFVQPLLRLSLAVLWVATGLLSFGLYPAGKSFDLLREIGLHGWPAVLALYGGACLDLLLGLLLLAGQRTKTVGVMMLASMAVFSALALRLPADFWLHPFAPLLKNLPIFAAILALMAMEA